MMKRTFIVIAAIVAAVTLTYMPATKVSAQSNTRYRDAFGIRPGGLFDHFGTTQFAPVALASAINLQVPPGTMFAVTGTAKTTRITNSSTVLGTGTSNALAGRLVIFVCASTDTLVDGVNLKLAGNFNGTADDMIALMYGASGAAADTFWTEVWRSVN